MNKIILTVLFSLVSGVVMAQQAMSVEKLRISPERMEARIAALARFGVADGHGHRVAYSKADQEGRAWYMQQLRDMGMDVSIDFAGNIVGKRQGKNNSLKPIAFGSHIDMVPDGGNYDGCVGSVAALEVIHVLNENNIITNHPLLVLIFSDEEGGTTGSNALAGHLSTKELQLTSNSGLTIAEGIKAIGGNPDSISEVAMQKGDLAAFLELHIEQGGMLERDNIQIGIVEGIVGIYQWEVVFEGFANHAGTTPMPMRKDALVAASAFVLAVNETVSNMEGRQVATVGKIKAEPGAPNVIPGKVITSLEIRDLDIEKIQSVFDAIKKSADAIAEKTGVSISFKQTWNLKPALTADPIKTQIAVVTKQLGYSSQQMPSGAGHDAQEMAAIAPVGMIFVPSKNGISHSPKEYTSPADMANGANVLLHTILALDGR